MYAAGKKAYDESVIVRIYTYVYIRTTYSRARIQSGRLSEGFSCQIKGEGWTEGEGGVINSRREA